MLTSRSRRLDCRLLATVSLLLTAGVLADSPERPCSAFEATKTLDGDTATFRDARFPWKVTAALDGKVVIENTRKKTTCSTNLESVVSVYIGSGDLIYFRSVEIASDELFTLNGFSCKDASKVKPLDAKSEAKTRKILRAGGICTTH
jgi:hypothetical protein